MKFLTLTLTLIILCSLLSGCVMRNSFSFTNASPYIIEVTTCETCLFSDTKELAPFDRKVSKIINGAIPNIKVSVLATGEEYYYCLDIFPARKVFFYENGLIGFSYNADSSNAIFIMPNKDNWVYFRHKNFALQETWIPSVFPKEKWAAREVVSTKDIRFVGDEKIETFYKRVQNEANIVLSPNSCSCCPKLISE